MSHTPWNRTRPHQDEAETGHHRRDGQDKNVYLTGEPKDRPTADPTEHDDDPGVFPRLRRIYQEVVEEPLPDVFLSLVRRLKGGNGKA